MILTAINPTTDGLEKTFVSRAIAAGATAIPVKNSDRFATTERILLGEMGQEHSEILTIGSLTDTQITLSAGGAFSHSVDDPVYKVRYDQVRFYRSIAGVDGSYSLLATVDMDVDNADLQTRYDDTTGLSTYYYKVSFYNSVSTLESEQSDPVIGTGYTRGTLGKAIDEFLREVRDEEQQFITRQILIDWANECNDDLQERTEKPFDFLHTRLVKARTASTNYIDFPTDDDGNSLVWKFDRIDHEFNDGVINETYTLRYFPPEKFRSYYYDNDASESDTTKHYTLDDAVDRIRIAPTPETTDADAFYIYYWKKFTELNSEGDVLETPTPGIYKKYWRWRFYTLKAKTDSSLVGQADRELADYEQNVRRLQHTNQKDGGSPKGFGAPLSGVRGYRRY